MPKENNIMKIETGAENPILRQKAKEIKKITLEIKELILDMEKTCENADGVGLAAPQVGKSLRLFITRIPLSEKEYFTKEFINPEVMQKSEKNIKMEEGCLSLPDFYTNVKRSEKITLKFRDKNYKEQTIEASGFLARVIQHEIDHLNGILISDRITN